HDLERLGLHLAVAEKGVLRILGELFHPIAQLRRVNVQVLRCLNIGHASILDQAYSLKLELSRKLPSLHDPPPAPSKHLTRCLRNRVQATIAFVIGTEVYDHLEMVMDRFEDVANEISAIIIENV